MDKTLLSLSSLSVLLCILLSSSRSSITAIDQTHMWNEFLILYQDPNILEIDLCDEYINDKSYIVTGRICDPICG